MSSSHFLRNNWGKCAAAGVVGTSITLAMIFNLDQVASFIVKNNSIVSRSGAENLYYIFSFFAGGSGGASYFTLLRKLDSRNQAPHHNTV